MISLKYSADWLDDIFFPRYKFNIESNFWTEPYFDSDYKSLS